MIKLLYKSLGKKNKLFANNLIIFLIKNNIINISFLPANFRNYISGEMVFNYKKSLKKDSRGFYYVYPQFKSSDLDRYYESLYWTQFRSDNQVSINQRDIEQYNLIIKNTGDFFMSKKRTFVNFGSGHGGVSFLFYYNGHNVINIDPDKNVFNSIDLDKNRWIKLSSINDLNSQIDFFYSSHSLEHVADIDDFLAILNKQLTKKKSTYLFFEVPDGDHEFNGGKSGKIMTPHTYYFTTKFFEKLSIENCYTQKEYRVIRYLGRYENDEIEIR